MSDHRVRQAISMAINREEIADSVYLGSRLPADGFWAPSIPGHRDEACPNLLYNPDRAKELWEEAGSPTGTLTITYNADGGHAEWVEATGNQLRAELGLDVQYEPVATFGEYGEIREAANFPNGTAYRLGWGMDYPSPENYLKPILGTGGSSNEMGYSNTEMDALITEGDSQASLEEGIPFYQQAEDLVCQDLPIYPMFYGRNQFVWSEKIDNVFVDAFAHVDAPAVTSEEIWSMNWSYPENLLIPSDTSESGGNRVLSTIFEPLVTFDRELNLEMAMAESVETSDGGTNWTITLKDWTYHDGTPVTAQDYVDSWNYGALSTNAHENSSFFSNIAGYADVNPPVPEGETAAPAPTVDTMSGLAVVDDKTFTVELTSPSPTLFPLSLYYAAFYATPAAARDDTETYGVNPVGSGPFQLTENVVDESITVERWADYPGEAAGSPGIRFVAYEDLDTAYLDAVDGNVDMMEAIPSSAISNAPTDFGDRFAESPNANFTFLGIPCYSLEGENCTSE